MTNNDSTTAANNKSVTPPEWGAPEWEKMNDENFAENLIAKIRDEKAILTCEEMDIIEKFWELDRSTRRCTLIALTKPYSWLEEQVQNDTKFAESMIELYQCIDPEKYKTIANLLLDANRRIMCAITCRDDMKDLMDKVKTEQEK